jgi:hypothetical protein
MSYAIAAKESWPSNLVGTDIVSILAIDFRKRSMFRLYENPATPAVGFSFLYANEREYTRINANSPGPFYYPFETQTPFPFYLKFLASRKPHSNDFRNTIYKVAKSNDPLNLKPC